MISRSEHEVGGDRFGVRVSDYPEYRVRLGDEGYDDGFPIDRPR